MPKNDIHQYGLQLESRLAALERASISERNKSLIQQFDRACFLEGLGKARRIRLLSGLVILARDYVKRDLDKATAEELKDVVMQLESREDWSPWTKHGYKVTLKKFYKFLQFGDGYRDVKEYPKIISWLRVHIRRKDQPKVKASDILTEAEVKRLTDVAEHPRDKAFVSMLYELGARIGEIGGVLIKDITRDKYGYLVDLEGKTGHRTPRIVISDPHLTQWLNVHPFKEDPDAPLWVLIGNRDKGKPMRYESFRALVRRLVGKADVKKRVYPHLFRHTRVTHLLINRQINEAQAKVYFGWVPNSTMLSEYSHLISSDVNDAILAMHGITTEKEKESVLKPQQCPRCETINTTDAMFCNRCGSPLDVRTAIKLDEERKESDDVMSTLVKDPQIQELLVKKIVQMGLAETLLQGTEKQ